MASPFRSYVQISRGQIARNYRSVREVVGPGVEVLGVVKADAYGHGAVEVSRVLEEEGARWLAVSSVEEGIALRLAGRAARILVMAGVLPYEREALLEYDLTPVVHSLADLAALDHFARSRDRQIRFHLKFDSGMARLGTLAGVEAIL
ncbi:MAG: alanine racemase, partial [Bryobacteraceae bacterium]